MLNKLLKYDLKYMIKNMGIFYILSIFFAITTRFLFSIDKSVIVNIIGQISVGCLFAMIANIIINTLMRSWVRFKESIYKDEAYLTHTLPVTKNNIYNSKLLQALLFSVVGFIIIIISLFIAYYTKERWLLLTNFLHQITTGLNFKTSFYVIGMLLVIFLEVFNALQCGFLGIILGHRKNNARIGFSVLYGFISYLISQSIVLLLVFIVGLFDSSIMGLFKNAMVINVGAYKTLMILAIILYLIIIYIMSLICKKVFNKGVNIE